jgi:hypothetical protein
LGYKIKLNHKAGKGSVSTAIYTIVAAAVPVQCPVTFHPNISILSIMEEEISLPVTIPRNL